MTFPDHNPEARWLGEDDGRTPEQRRQAERWAGMPCDPMTPAQRALLESIDPETSPRWWLLADAILRITDAGRIRFSRTEVYAGRARAGETEHMEAVGLLRIHRYDSGAWHYQTTPTTRSFLMALWTQRPASVAAVTPVADLASIPDVEGNA